VVLFPVLPVFLVALLFPVDPSAADLPPALMELHQLPEAPPVLPEALLAVSEAARSLDFRSDLVDLPLVFEELLLLVFPVVHLLLDLEECHLLVREADLEEKRESEKNEKGNEEKREKKKSLIEEK